MFDHVCTACEQRRIMFPSQVTSIEVLDHGIQVSFTCWCGAEQQVLTGRDHSVPAAA